MVKIGFIQAEDKDKNDHKCVKYYSSLLSLATDIVEQYKDKYKKLTRSHVKFKASKDVNLYDWKDPYEVSIVKGNTTEVIGYCAGEYDE